MLPKLGMDGAAHMSAVLSPHFPQLPAPTISWRLAWSSVPMLKLPLVAEFGSGVAYVEEGPMGYRNKTYVIFDGDKDMWAYAFMKGWKANEKVEFDFHDAHGINTITDRSNEENTKKKLRERLSNTKHAVVLIGNSTKNLFRFVRWEIETCQKLGMPIVVANLNGLRHMDEALCPPILKGADAIHVSFKMKIIKYALDDFCDNYQTYKGRGQNYRYADRVYVGLGL